MIKTNNPENWLCDCGKRGVFNSPEWRWDGKNWQHHHPYPVSHVIAEYKPLSKKEKTEKLQNELLWKELMKPPRKPKKEEDVTSADK